MLHLSFQVGRRLRIQRTFKSSDGKQFVRTEYVKNQAVIDAYLRFNKDKNIRCYILSRLPLRQFVKESVNLT